MNTLKFGNGEWYGKKDTILAYNDENSNFKPLPFSFDRDTLATRVNKDGLIETVGSGEPRIDYKDDSKGALKLEPSRSNAITNSEEFGSTGWSFVTTGSAIAPIVSNNYAISPDGTQNAQRIQFDLGGGTTTSDRTIIRQNVGAQSDWFLSVWMKSTNGTEQKILWHTTADSNETVVTGEWQRFTFSRNGVNNSWAGLGLRGSVSDVDTADILVYGFQAEQGSYATSYIPSSGGAVTRNQDSCEQTVPSGVIGQTEGTIFVDVDFKTLSDTNMFVSIRPDASNKIEIYRTDAAIYGEFASDASFNFNKPSVTVGRYKIAVAYSSGSSAMYINGVLIASNTTAFAFTSTLDGIYINSRGTSFIEQSNYNDIKLYNTRLSNAELQALTTI